MSPFLSRLSLLVGTVLGTAALVGCRPSVRDVVPTGTDDDDRIALDTEMVCSRRDAGAYGQIFVVSTRWRSLARRADVRPPDRSAYDEIVALMRTNHERFRDSACTEEMVERLAARIPHPE